MRLRQVALVARQLDPVVDALCRTFELEVSFRDPGVETFGLRNAVMPVGDTFLEVVSPEREDASAARFLERRGGDGGYMVIVQSDDLEADRLRLKQLGVRIVWELALDDAATIHAHPRDVGGAILSFDVMHPTESWRWAGPSWPEHVRTARATSLAAVELEARDPPALASRWSEVLDRPAAPGPGADEWEIALDDGRIRVVPERDGRGDGLSCVELVAADPAQAGEEHDLGGTRFRLVRS